jgi:hypothetical protein
MGLSSAVQLGKGYGDGKFTATPFIEMAPKNP